MKKGFQTSKEGTLSRLDREKNTVQSNNNY